MGSLTGGLGNHVSKAVGVEEGGFVHAPPAVGSKAWRPGEPRGRWTFPIYPSPQFVGVCACACMCVCASLLLHFSLICHFGQGVAGQAACSWEGLSCWRFQIELVSG